ncbi:hypothetical protein SAMN02746064_01479 [Alkalibacter saccharofermentans DSM 14828]|uniref:Uncharacterized protein n=1 Tax=Alkalibacter saccharofermentans DSM 14828 TaxID=1120975 RepID=A0A1M4XD26_9FIRM|nr:hypothetical protein SAMN02746064_01479 [Alkalibacter saccharofermentans DSM 14828]
MHQPLETGRSITAVSPSQETCLKSVNVNDGKVYGLVCMDEIVSFFYSTSFQGRVFNKNNGRKHYVAIERNIIKNRACG